MRSAANEYNISRLERLDRTAHTIGVRQVKELHVIPFVMLLSEENGILRSWRIELSSQKMECMENINKVSDSRRTWTDGRRRDNNNNLAIRLGGVHSALALL